MKKNKIDVLGTKHFSITTYDYSIRLNVSTCEPIIYLEFKILDSNKSLVEYSIHTQLNSMQNLLVYQFILQEVEKLQKGKNVHNKKNI